MEQRRLRLGDILDDYCPRERRVTNHAIVAMIEEDVKQTRCTTCDAEHAYKGARVPKRRKKEPLVAVAPPSDGSNVDVVELADEVDRDDIREDRQLPMHTDDNVSDLHTANQEAPAMPDPAGTPEPAASPSVEFESQPPAADEPAADGPVHRPLIRATLPRPEGQKDARPLPEFTVRQSPTRGGGHGNANGNFRGERMRLRGGSGNGASGGNRGHGGARFHGGSGNRPSGSGRQPMGRGGPPSGFRNGNSGPNGKRGRGSRG